MSRSEIRCVLFDLDGTLVDSLPGIRSALIAALDPADAFSLREVRSWLGDGATALVERAWASRRSAKASRDQVERFERLLLELGPQQAAPYEGVLEMLASAVASGRRLAVLSNKPHQAVVEMIDAVLDGRFFCAVRGVEEDRLRKPVPTLARGLVETIGIPADQTALVGDSPVDMETAQRAGLMAIGVAWGYRSVDSLRRCGADWILEHPADLASWLENTNRTLQ